MNDHDGYLKYDHKNRRRVSFGAEARCLSPDSMAQLKGETLRRKDRTSAARDRMLPFWSTLVHFFKLGVRKNK